MSHTLEIDDEQQTRELGRELAALLGPGDVVGLCGDLGAGKTCLAAAVARALGVGDDAGVSSPTFTIVNEYTGGRLPVYHMDFYRLATADDLYELGIWEYYEGDGVCLVEWFDRFPEHQPTGALTIIIELLPGQRRRITLTGTGRGLELASAPAGIDARASEGSNGVTRQARGHRTPPPPGDQRK